jgi:AraC family transcriptional regulator, regulatory protein of adaptative response / methylated-DNA-[protein]-cysteine methyltransferase
MDSQQDVERWAAVQAKDASRDGQFVFAVKTTGIYCRPSCPAKTAKRENVIFFTTTRDASSAGFRACKRCQPDGEGQIQRYHQLAQRACVLMQQSEQALNLTQLAQQLEISPHHFHRVFKAVVGVTPKAYQQSLLKQRMVNALDKAGSVTEAIYEAGYQSAGRYYEAANAMLGMTAQTFRTNGAGEKIRYAVQPSALGMLLIAATECGVCAIELGDSESELTQRLQTRFANATFEATDAQFNDWLAKTLAFIQLPRTGLDLPLDIQGTAFQRRVWQALQDIPAGVTLSYSQLAQQIGQPSAVRAVASACAANQLALVIPCHRIVRSDGSLSGYRWGVQRKAQLLKAEKAEDEE